jgi:hypothetical protein
MLLPEPFEFLLEEADGVEAFAGFVVVGFDFEDFFEEDGGAFEVFVVELADAEVAED